MAAPKQVQDGSPMSECTIFVFALNRPIYVLRGIWAMFVSQARSLNLRINVPRVEDALQLDLTNTGNPYQVHWELIKLLLSLQNGERQGMMQIMTQLDGNNNNNNNTTKSKRK